jgi:hypothetical protein
MTSAARYPAAEPVDELELARLRRTLVNRFGEFNLLDLHLAMLDARGAWYAAAAAECWSPALRHEFFGLVRHVVRTQMPGPAPDPDVETWLAAGRPKDSHLATAWDLVAAESAHQFIAKRGGKPSAAVRRLDHYLMKWPAADLATFAQAYARFEAVLVTHHVTLPPIR